MEQRAAKKIRTKEQKIARSKDTKEEAGKNKEMRR